MKEKIKYNIPATLQNGKQKGQTIPESIEIKGVFLRTKKSVVKLGLVIE